MFGFIVRNIHKPGRREQDWSGVEEQHRMKIGKITNTYGLTGTGLKLFVEGREIAEFVSVDFGEGELSGLAVE